MSDCKLTRRNLKLARKDLAPNTSSLEAIFAESKLSTAYGQFKIRVYRDAPNRETVVLWRGDPSANQPVLVRVHSECLTGDVLGSRHCDCGDQLHESLRIIGKKGGILVYLRQEGRGIGLFDKIRAYDLQSKGHDTHEANILLGHRPDARSYEMAAIALRDLGIDCIRLLTNNPSKVSELAKLGIEVRERVPLVVGHESCNARYCETKKAKFGHIFHGSSPKYYYQFQAQTPDHIRNVGEYISGRLRDPLLMIHAGIAANASSLKDTKRRQAIRAIFSTCEEYPGIEPVLHFTFCDADDPVEVLRQVNKKLPFARYIQTNDVVSYTPEFIETAAQLFQVYLPLSNHSFSIIKDDRVRNLIIKHDIFIVLDNSQGRGIQDSLPLLRTRIQTLLDYGINNIALAGGFGPDDLKTYFELRRYFRINLSIDAETKLKTNGHFDQEKTREFIHQLIRFDDPKEQCIEQTRTFLTEHRRTQIETANIHGKTFSIYPDVFHAGQFPSTAWFSQELKKLTFGDTDFCEVGCGSGVICCLLALGNPNLNVVATDFNPHATDNTQENVHAHHLEDQVTVLNGDVLDSLNPDEQFDSIFWAMPFGFLDPGAQVGYEEASVFDPGYRSIRKFLHTARDHLKPGGRLLLGFSPDLGHSDLLEDIANEHGVTVSLTSEMVMTETVTVHFQILTGVYDGARQVSPQSPQMVHQDAHLEVLSFSRDR